METWHSESGQMAHTRFADSLKGLPQRGVVEQAVRSLGLLARWRKPPPRPGDLSHKTEHRVFLDRGRGELEVIEHGAARAHEACAGLVYTFTQGYLRARLVWTLEGEEVARTSVVWGRSDYHKCWTGTWPYQGLTPLLIHDDGPGWYVRDLEGSLDRGEAVLLAVTQRALDSAVYYCAGLAQVWQASLPSQGLTHDPHHMGEVRGSLDAALLDAALHRYAQHTERALYSAHGEARAWHQDERRVWSQHIENVLRGADAAPCIHVERISGEGWQTVTPWQLVEMIQRWRHQRALH